MAILYGPWYWTAGIAAVLAALALVAYFALRDSDPVKAD
jgi:hypothetical protein